MGNRSQAGCQIVIYRRTDTVFIKGCGNTLFIQCLRISKLCSPSQCSFRSEKIHFRSTHPVSRRVRSNIRLGEVGVNRVLLISIAGRNCLIFFTVISLCCIRAGRSFKISTQTRIFVTQQIRKHGRSHTTFIILV